MTITLDIDRITERAKKARPGQTLLMIVGALFIGFGWLVGRLIGWGWLAVVWPVAAVAEGFSQGFKDTPYQKTRLIRAQARAARAES